MNKLCLYSIWKIWVFHGFAHFQQSFQHQMFCCVNNPMNIFIGENVHKKLTPFAWERALTGFVSLGYDGSKIFTLKENALKKFFKSPYFQFGTTVLWVVCGCILFNAVLQNLDVVIAAVGKVLEILTPFIWGFVIAYLLLPMTRYFEYRMLNPLMCKLTKKQVPSGGFPRMVAIALALLSAGVAFFVLIRILLPTVYESVSSIYTNYSVYLNNLTAVINGLLENNPELAHDVEALLRNASDELANWVNTELMPTIANLLGDVKGVILTVTGGVYRALLYVLDILIGAVISCYVLYNRERFAATWKRMMYALLGVKRCEKSVELVHFANEAFMGFLIGKIIDSAIIGVLTYFASELLKMPYPAFIAIIVGVTNIIPIFGPFIGAVPGAIIILMVNPMKLPLFLLMIFIIQQIDGNIIGPKILGNSVGINGFWIMFAIIVMGDLFGVAGMIIGVPLFVVLTSAFEGMLSMGLKKRGLSDEAALYVDMSHMDPETGIPVPKTREQMTVGKEPPKHLEKSTESGE